MSEQRDWTRDGGAAGRADLACQYIFLTSIFMSLVLFPTVIINKPFEDRDDIPYAWLNVGPHRGDVADTLATFDFVDLAKTMASDMKPLEAQAFSFKLSTAADTLEQQRYLTELHAPCPDPNLGAERCQEWARNSELAEAAEKIRKAAGWYSDVAEAGFGVHVVS